MRHWCHRVKDFDHLAVFGITFCSTLLSKPSDTSPRYRSLLHPQKYTIQGSWNWDHLKVGCLLHLFQLITKMNFIHFFYLECRHRVKINVRYKCLSTVTGLDQQALWKIRFFTFSVFDRCDKMIVPDKTTLLSILQIIPPPNNWEVWSPVNVYTLKIWNEPES